MKRHNKTSQGVVEIEDIEREPDKIFHFDFEGSIEKLKDCELSASLDLKSLGNFIEVKGNVEGQIQLECDRCLNKYQYDFDFDIDETYAKHSLYDEYGQELELQSGQFVTDLNGEKEIDIYDLLYQSVILNLPNKKVCGINCNEGLFVSDEQMQEVSDNRMDVFKNIKIEKQQN